MNDNIFIRYFNGEMDIFNYLKPNKNNMLSEMYGDELLDFLYYLDKCYLELRRSLELNDDITFGLELEFEHLDNFSKCKREFDEKFNRGREAVCYDRIWIFKTDPTLPDNSGEIASPILKDDVYTWNILEEICNYILLHAKIGKNCASHVHIGAHVLGDNVNAWINFFKLWSAYENIIFKFLYGQYLSARGYVRDLSKPISNILWNDYMYLIKKSDVTSRDALARVKNLKKMYAINFMNSKLSSEMKRGNTIEFRVPNGTLDPVIWQNNVNLIVKLLEYVKSDKFNDQVVSDRREKNFNKYSDLMFYDEIYLEQALELSDLIFDNNLDKIYFMRQYLKSFEVGHEPMVDAKPFTRKRIVR